MKTFFKTLLILTLLIFITACSSLSSLPEISSDAESEAAESTPQGQANDQGEDEAGYDGEGDLIDPACQMEMVVIEVDYDHRWTWSPDGTENTGHYIGTAKGTATFLLSNDGYGNLATYTDTIFFSQEGEIQGDPDKCTISDGRGMAEMDLYGTCKDGVIVLEWLEIATGESEATMVCDGKTTPFTTFHPVQFVAGVVLGDDGLAYKQSNNTDMMNFRDISMEWTFRFVSD